MQIHAIVEWLYLDKRVNEFIGKQQPAELQADLLHHCILEIYRIHDKTPGKIEALHAADQLWPWFHGMACMQLRSKKSTFFARFRRTFEPVEAIPVRHHHDINYQKEEDEAIRKYGTNFINYFYTKLPERKPKVKVESIALLLF